MPRGPQPHWTRSAEHTERMRPFVESLLAQHGYETEAVIACDNADEATQARRGIFNAARQCKVSASVNVEPSGSKWLVKFTLHDKAAARAYIVGKHGSNRADWPYDPRRPNTE